jgi:metal-responsive CopG/Arc/MetJ family transcriptional regulator
MARPKMKEPKKQYTVMLKPSMVKEIDRLAKKVELSRSQFMENLISTGLDDAKIFDKIGALWVIKSTGRAFRLLKKEFLGKDSKLENET